MDADIFRVGWIVIISAALLWEFAALLFGEPGSTLSANVWSLRGTGFFSLIIFFLFWLIYHFIVEGGKR
jgi:hypothetical protein